MTFKPDSNTSRSPHDWTDKTVPLWLRTQRRLQNMETFAARHRITSGGTSSNTQMLEERIALASSHLVRLIKEREERGS